MAVLHKKGVKTMTDTKEWERFLAVYNSNSISKAAKSLYMSQQGLSKSIRNLEETIGLPLFKRDKSGVTPTEFGKSLYPYASRLLRDYEAIQNFINESKAHKVGTLNIGFSLGVLNAIPIISILRDFNMQYPNIKVNALDLTDFVCEDMLVNEKLDMAFIVGPIFNDQIIETQIYSEPYMLWVNAENPKAAKSSLKFEDIRDEPIIFAGNNFRAHHQLNLIFEKMGAVPKLSFSPIEPTTFFSMTSQKAGIAIHPAHWERYIANDEKVVSIPLSEPEWRWEVYFAQKADRMVDPNTKLLTKEIFRALKVES